MKIKNLLGFFGLAVLVVFVFFNLSLTKVHAIENGDGEVTCGSDIHCWDQWSGDAIDRYTGKKLCCYAYAGIQGCAKDK